MPTSNVATASARTQPPPSCPGAAEWSWPQHVVSGAWSGGDVGGEPGIIIDEAKGARGDSANSPLRGLMDSPRVGR